MKKRGRHADYKIFRNEVSTQIQNSKQASYKSKIEAGKDDPKSTWKFFKEFSASNKKKDNTDCFKLNIDDKLITNTKEIADTFNDYFVKIASKLKEPIEDCDFTQLKEHIDTKVPSSVSFELPHITESFVYNFLLTLDVSKSTGLDGIGPRLLKLSSSVITRSITYIAQAYISKGYFPDSWKQAKVNPLYKGGRRKK